MDSRKAAEKLMASLDVDHTQYRFGHTKVTGRDYYCLCKENSEDLVFNLQNRTQQFLVVVFNGYLITQETSKIATK